MDLQTCCVKVHFTDDGQKIRLAMNSVESEEISDFLVVKI